MTEKKTRVLVGMSGGVDSSVTAALLKVQGYEVIGMTLRLWSEEHLGMENHCCTVDALADARHIAGRLDIPFYAVDAKEVFHDIVVSTFVEGYKEGITPNPCLVCNRRIRWGFMYRRGRALGADYLATGHYARLRRSDSGQVQLLRGVDRDKDQSYVLYVLDQNLLQHTLLPLGGYTKEEVRDLAESFQLPVADRPDSQDLCFLGGDDYRDFLIRNVPEVKEPGPILNTQGQKLGDHPGLAFFTIGQRKGLGISPPSPHYVLDKDPKRNALIVGTREELGKDTLIAGDVKWISGSPPPAPVQAEIKIRYTAPAREGVVTPLDGRKVKVHFPEPLRDITPGQAAVFYQDELCLGGGIIQRAV
ncbi:MAG: tRNA 2-thiouridine(34) synthase MnmA [Anaerolineales bacterium]